MSAIAQSEAGPPSDGDSAPASEAVEPGSAANPLPSSLPTDAASSEPGGPRAQPSDGESNLGQEAPLLLDDGQATPTTEGPSSESELSEDRRPPQQEQQQEQEQEAAATRSALVESSLSVPTIISEEVSTEGTVEDHGSITEQSSLTDEPLSLDPTTEEGSLSDYSSSSSTSSLPSSSSSSSSSLASSSSSASSPPSSSTSSSSATAAAGKKLMPKLFEYFFVVGLESNDVVDLTATDRRYPPKILYHYPEESKSIRSISQIVDFCFPSEVGIRLVKKTNSASNLNELLYGQSFRHNDEQSFIFMLTIDDGKVHLYGICVIKDELLKEYPSFLTSPRSARRARVALPDMASVSGAGVPSSTSAPKLSSSVSNIEARHFVVSPRCYCFLSRYPFFRPHFELIYALLGLERFLRVQRLYSHETDDKHAGDHPPPTTTAATTGQQAIAIPGTAADSEKTQVASTSPGASSSLATATSLALPGTPPRHRRTVSASSAVTGAPGHAGSGLETSLSEAETRKSAWDAEYAQLRDKERARTIKELNSPEVRELLSTYYNSHFPQPGERNVISLPPGNPPIACQFPPGDYQALLISDWAMGSCTRALSLNNILLILGAAMLERPVVFASQHLGVLSNTVMSLIPMLRPLVWQGLFVPLLPARMHDLLDAPVPYLFGVQNIPQRLLKRTELTIVFLDSDKLQPATDLFPLPELAKLRTNLLPSFSKLHHGANSHPSNSSRQQLLAIQEFSKLIRDYIHEVTDSIFRSLHRQQGFSHVFNPRLFESHEDYKSKKQAAITQFLRRVHITNRPFVSAFIQTQHFFHYVDQQLKLLKKKRREAAEKAAPDAAPITEPITPTPVVPPSAQPPSN